jgi:hypothetical protein
MTMEMVRKFRSTMPKWSKVWMEESIEESILRQTKLPEFWGQKENDSIAPNEFIKRIDNMDVAKVWSDHITFWNFALALRGSDNTWLESQATLEDITSDCRAWTII